MQGGQRAAGKAARKLRAAADRSVDRLVDVTTLDGSLLYLFVRRSTSI